MNIFCSLWRLRNQDYVVSEDQVGEVLTHYVDSFFLSAHPTDHEVLEAGWEGLWRDVVALPCSSLQLDLVALLVKVQSCNDVAQL